VFVLAIKYLARNFWAKPESLNFSQSELLWTLRKRTTTATWTSYQTAKSIFNTIISCL